MPAVNSIKICYRDNIGIFDHSNDLRLAIIGRIILRGLVIYVFVGPIKIYFPVLFYFPKKKRWFSHFRYHFLIRILLPHSL